MHSQVIFGLMVMSYERHDFCTSDGGGGGGGGGGGAKNTVYHVGLWFGIFFFVEVKQNCTFSYSQLNHKSEWHSCGSFIHLVLFCE